jgi:hypothetical protein
VANGKTGTSALTFTVSLDRASNLPARVDYVTVDGSATAGQDYFAAAGTLTFAAGETTRTLTVLVIGDAPPEPNETFLVSLSNASNSTTRTGRGTATGTIVDATAMLGIAISSGAGAPVEGAPADVRLTVTNGGPDPATNVVFGFAGDAPSGATVTVVGVSSSSPGVVCQVSTCIAAALAPGAAVEMVVRETFGVATQGVAGTDRVTYTVAADQFDPDLANNSASEQVAVRPLAADLSIQVTGQQTNNLVEGTGGAYTVRVTNLGPDTETHATVQIDHQLGAGATINSVSFFTGAIGVSCPAATCTIASLAAGATVTMVLSIGFELDTPHVGGSNQFFVTATPTTFDPDLANNSASEQVAVRPLETPAGLIQGVRAQLVALLATAKRNPDANMLQAAIAKLTDALAPSNWTDADHLDPQSGDRVFAELKDAAAALGRLAADRHAQVSTAGVAAMVAELARAARDLAATAIADATSAGGDAKRRAAAQAELGQGDDALLTRGPVDAIGHYKDAWQRALMSIHKL